MTATGSDVRPCPLSLPPADDDVQVITGGEVVVNILRSDNPKLSEPLSVTFGKHEMVDFSNVLLQHLEFRFG
jgi:hypothetical protein